MLADVRSVYYTTASQRPDKAIKFDFNMMHHLNSSIFLSRFMKLQFLPMEAKIRLLNWKARNDLVQYTARGAPTLRLDEIENYKSKQPSDWPGLFERVNQFPDDGHTAKFMRNLAHAEVVCSVWQSTNKESFRIQGDMWRKLGNMLIDSVEAGEPHWIRSAGFDEAWENVPARGEYKIL
jgi:Questin oxidase-like